MTDNKHPVDRAIDLFVYAPLGFALDAHTLLPQLVDRGRDQLNNQLTMAKMMGQFAVQQGQSEAGKHLATLQQQATEVLTEFGLLPRIEPDAPEPADAPGAGTPAATATPAKRSATTRTRAVASAPAAAPPVDLAIPDYDSLAASQVIPRLEGLAAAELEAVHGYEASHRGRKTILNKIAQLQG